MSEPRARETTVQQDAERTYRKETYGNYGPVKRIGVDLGLVKPWSQADPETQKRETDKYIGRVGTIRGAFDD